VHDQTVHDQSTHDQTEHDQSMSARSRWGDRMRNKTGRRVLAGRLLAGLTAGLIAVGVTGCAGGANEEENGSANGDAAKVEQVDGSNIPMITLSPEAAERLGVATDPVTMQPSGAIQQPAIPYKAVVYDAQGQAFTYVSSQPHVYTRVPLTVDDVQGDMAVLATGPAVGTPVVTTGAAELWGAETGVGAED